MSILLGQATATRYALRRPGSEREPELHPEGRLFSAAPPILREFSFWYGPAVPRFDWWLLRQKDEYLLSVRIENTHVAITPGRRFLRQFGETHHHSCEGDTIPIQLRSSPPRPSTPQRAVH